MTDPSVKRWHDADVLLGLDPTAKLPTDVTSPWGAKWGLVGFLDGKAGVTDEPEWKTENTTAWGGYIIDASESEFSQARTFTALAETLNVAKLVWPGSDETRIVVPEHGPIQIGFEFRRGDYVERRTTANYAQVSKVKLGPDAETGVKSFEITLQIFPTSDQEKRLWNVVKGKITAPAGG